MYPMHEHSLSCHFLSSSTKHPWYQVELWLYGLTNVEHISSGVDEDFAKGEARQWIRKAGLWVRPLKVCGHSNVGKLYCCNYK